VAWAGNTPLRLWKRYTWLGGTRAPLIAHWPSRIAARGEIRSQITHVVDLMPTVLAACGVEAPQAVDGVPQLPMAGRSLLPTFDDPEAPAPRTTQYFEMLGSRSIIHGAWKATTDHVSRGVLDEERLLLGSRGFATDRWSLFDLSSDFAEAHDLAGRHPEVVEELEDLWFDEAERHQVLPLDDTMQERLAALIFPAYGIPTRRAYRPGGGPVHDETLPPLFGGFVLTADIDVPAEGTSGVLCALGDLHGGFVLHMPEGRLAFACSRAGHVDRVVAASPLPPGRQVVGVQYDLETRSFLLLQSGIVVASVELGGEFPIAFQHGGSELCIGYDRGLAVEDSYQVPGSFTGTLHEVVIDLAKPAGISLESTIRAALHSD
jgi:hypothetical protein